MLTLVTRSLLVGNAICAALGLLAALVGGSLEGLGSGAGGLAGVPTFLLLVVAAVCLVAGVALAVRGGRSALGQAALLALGPLLVFAVTFQGAHVIDPCNLGVLDLGDKYDGTRVCWPADGGLYVNERFHLLHHGVVGTVAAGALVLATRRRTPQRPAG
jgi:hypothetical protein